MSTQKKGICWMDKPESPNQGEEEAAATPHRAAHRSRWMVTFAVVAMAGAVVSLTSLRGSTASTTDAQPGVDLAALSQQSPLALPLYEQLSQSTGSIAGAAAPVQAVAAAAPAAVAPTAAVAPAAGVAATPATTGMAGMSSSGSESCTKSEVLSAFLAHIKSAHLETSPGQQVSDALNLDQYIKTHTVWLESVFKPLMDGSAGQSVSDTLAPIWAHIQSAHLETSLGQQVTDLLNFDQYLKTHTVWLESVLTPLVTQASC
jgi:hypothetical protein